METIQLRQLNHLSPADRFLVGDKIFYLSQLAQQGEQIAPGWVVLPLSFRQFIEATSRLEPFLADLSTSSLHLNIGNALQLQAVAGRIQQALQATPLQWSGQPLVNLLANQALILRPSVSLAKRTSPLSLAALGGLLPAQTCWATPAALCTTLKTIWAEVFSAKSLFYWQRSQIQIQDIQLAVLIQPLLPASFAGRLQRSQDRTQIWVVSGLGKTLTQGEAIPTRYSIEQGQLRDRQLGRQLLRHQVADPGVSASCLVPHWLAAEIHPELSEDDLDDLMRLAQRTETILGTALELEWLMTASGDLYLTQGQPQTWRSPVIAPASASSTPTHPTLLTGLAAAPGQANGRTIVLRSPELPALAGQIVVAAQLLPDWLPALQQVAGVITEKGGLTSHGAILARELGIPAVVGVAQATQQLSTGDNVWIDGDRGLVSKTALPAAIAQFPQPQQRLSAKRLYTELLVNLSQPASLTPLKQIAVPVDGIGLLRSELMLLPLLEQQHPDYWLKQNWHDELTTRIANRLSLFAKAFSPRPVRYRSLDLRSHEFQDLKGSPPTEANPMLGLRGAWRYQHYPALFDIELKAIQQVYQSGLTNVQLMLPFVRTVEEVHFCRQRCEQIGLWQQAQFQLWLMAEVPSVLFLLSAYAQAGIRGIAIGTNDLTQLLLGVDRDRPEFSELYTESHPAVLAAIAQLMQTAQQLQLPCSICGQAPVRYPEMVRYLVELGISSISVEVDAIESTHRAIIQAEQRRS
ncbi:putative PEP-binding protein [Almyronema epifaneia]|uniref:Phosphoenolpyruvate synthase n=1 Tax=Almyronema epifaneia S1 TaxID=2991925 RepID=A0ABW6II22_9CYAN